MAPRGTRVERRLITDEFEDDNAVAICPPPSAVAIEPDVVAALIVTLII